MKFIDKIVEPQGVVVVTSRKKNDGTKETTIKVVPSKKGAESGAVLGAAIGGSVGGPGGAAIGAAIGSTIGGVLGPED